MNLSQMVYIVFSILFVTLFMIYANACGEREQPWYKWLLFGMFYFIIDTLVYFYLEGSFVYTFTSMFCCLVILYYVTRKVSKSFFYTGMWLVAGLVGESFSGYLLMFLYGFSVEDFQTNMKAFILCSTFTRTVQFVFVVVYSMIRNKKLEKRQSKYSFAVIVVLLGSIVLLDFVNSVMAKYVHGDNIYYFIIFSLIVFAINIVVYILYMELEKNYIENVNNIMLEEYVDKQKMEYEKVSIARHDMKNYIILLQDMIKEKNYEALERELINKQEKLNYEGTRLNSGNKYIDIILSNKINQAEEKGITVDVKVELLNTIEMENEEVVSLFGNIVDNAIEGCEKCKDAKIAIEIICEKGILSTTVKNTVVDNIIIKDNRLPATKKQELGHGWGTKSIQKIVSKYEGIVNYSCDDNIFCCQVKMFV